jgi:hypothetical protein
MEFPMFAHIARFARIPQKFNWHSLAEEINLPNLKRLEITDNHEVAHSEDGYGGADIMISVMEKMPALQCLVIHAVPLWSDLYVGEASEQEERLFAYLKQRNIAYIGPKHLTRSAGADFAFDFITSKFTNRCGWVGRSD